MAQNNPFLKSPFDDIGLGDQEALLPGQQAIRPTVAMPQVKAPPADVPEPEAPPVQQPRRRADNVLPPDNVRPIFEAAAREFDVPVNVLMALGHQESRYRANAIGQPTPYGRAKGMLQYIDDTAGTLGINPFDPAEAIPAAAKQLRERLDRGESMVDAVRGHFAGPDRRQWGAKTAAYGEEVMAKAGKIGDALYGSQTAQPQNDLASLQQQLEAEEPGRYRVLSEIEAADLRHQQLQRDSNQFSTALPREEYERTFRAMNPNATDDAIGVVMQQYDQQKAAQTQGAGNRVQQRFDTLQSPEARFNERLNQRLQQKSAGGVVPKLPERAVPPQVAQDDPGAADRETGFHAAANYLGKSLQAGLYDLAGAGARVLDEVNPWSVTPDQAAVLFKDDPAKLKDMQDNSVIMVLSRFANRMAKDSNETMQQLSARAKRDYGNLEYATTDPDKAAYLSPTKVIGDAVRSLPSTVALALSVYFTRGAAAQAEKQALAAGLSQEAAREAAVAAGARAMANVGAASEGTVGYAQQANQTVQELEKLPLEEFAKSPKFAQLLREGFTPETARAKLIADAGEQAGVIAGIADAAVNKVGGQFLGKILTEGGRLIPRIMKGAANESATETVQSALEQLGQNFATQVNVNPNQDLLQGVGEAAAAGAAVGGLTGGVAAGAGGRGHVETQPAAQEQAAPQPEAAPPAQQPLAPAAAAAPAAGPMARALEDAAEQHAGQPQRVTATAPNGEQVSGQINGYQEDADGNFVAQIVGDDGQVRTLDSRTGVQIEPEAAPDAGPLSAALSAAAEEHAATTEQPAPVVEAAQEVPALAPESAAPVDMPPEQSAPAAEQAAEPAIPSAPQPIAQQIATMDDAALQARLQYITEQARASGGWTKMFVEARNAVQRELRKRQQESSNALARVDTADTAPVVGDVNDAGNPPATPAGKAEPRRRARTEKPVLEQPAGAAAPVAAAGPAVSGEGAAAVEQPALTGFTSELDARQALAKQKLGKTHQVIERAHGQFELAPKAKQQPTRKADKLAAADAKHARQEALVREAAEKAEQRKSVKLVPQVEEQDRSGLTSQDRYMRDVQAAGEELALQISNDALEGDIPADEMLPGLRQFATASKVAADDLRQDVLRRIRKTDRLNKAQVKAIEKALSQVEESKRSEVSATTANQPAALTQGESNEERQQALPAGAEESPQQARQETADADVLSDDGADIPLAFMKRMKVPHEVFVQDENAYETVDVPAHQALASVREDIGNLRSLLDCLRS